MKSWKTILLCILTCLTLVLLQPQALAATEVASGTCGENLTWTLDDAGTLTISGKTYHFNASGICAKF